MEFVTIVLQKVSVDPQDLRKFLQDTKGAYFLFGPDLYDYLNDVYSQSMRLMAINQKLQGNLPIGPERSRLADEEQRLLLSYFEEQYDAARQLFAKYLALDFG